MSLEVIPVIGADRREICRFYASDSGALSAKAGPFSICRTLEDWIEIRRQLDNAIAIAQGIARAAA